MGGGGEGGLYRVRDGELDSKLIFNFHSTAKLCIVRMLMCVCVCVRVCVCVCARARVYALRIVSKDRILRFTNSLTII